MTSMNIQLLIFVFLANFSICVVANAQPYPPPPVFPRGVGTATRWLFEWRYWQDKQLW